MHIHLRVISGKRGTGKDRLFSARLSYQPVERLLSLSRFVCLWSRERSTKRRHAAHVPLFAWPVRPDFPWSRVCRELATSANVSLLFRALNSVHRVVWLQNYTDTQAVDAVVPCLGPWLPFFSFLSVHTIGCCVRTGKWRSPVILLDIRASTWVQMNGEPEGELTLALSMI